MSEETTSEDVKNREHSHVRLTGLLGGTADVWLREKCNRYANGQCYSSHCLQRGGFIGGQPDYSVATCEAYELITELEKLRDN